MRFTSSSLSSSLLLVCLVVINNSVIAAAAIIIILLFLVVRVAYLRYYGNDTKERWERERETHRGRKRDEKEMKNRQKKNEEGFYALLLLFLVGSTLFPKKIKQPTVRSRSVCVHTCQILRSFSTLLRQWSLFLYVSFWLTLFYYHHQYFEHTYLSIYLYLYIYM